MEGGGQKSAEKVSRLFEFTLINIIFIWNFLMPSCVVSDDPKDSKVELSFSKKLLYILFHLMWAINLIVFTDSELC